MANVFRPDDNSGFILTVGSTSVSSTSGQLNASQSTLYLCNEGPNAVCVRWGHGAQTANLNDLYIPAGSCQTFGKEGADYIAAICASGGTAKLHVIGGSGE